MGTLNQCWSCLFILTAVYYYQIILLHTVHYSFIQNICSFELDLLFSQWIVLVFHILVRFLCVIELFDRVFQPFNVSFNFVHCKSYDQKTRNMQNVMLHSDWLRSTSYCISKPSQLSSVWRTLVSKEWLLVKPTQNIDLFLYSEYRLIYSLSEKHWYDQNKS